MEFVQQHWNSAKTQCSLRNFGQKNPLKPKKIICVDLPIFSPRELPKRYKPAETMFFTRSQRNLSENTKIWQKCTISAKYYAKVDKNVQFGWKTSFCFSAKMSLFQF